MGVHQGEEVERGPHDHAGRYVVQGVPEEAGYAPDGEGVVVPPEVDDQFR